MQTQLLSVEVALHAGDNVLSCAPTRSHNPVRASVFDAKTSAVMPIQLDRWALR
jgi:hypothetical protein